ncbi:MAG: 2-C-methyl-D-erythritol 4-phosphate cytidylyltransferase [Bacteroidetes bacterium]|nr:2-C-methyl-D-erythritol 4-phosphate cytidylyltransferase [Bacteroidota bacterium]
MKKYAIIVAGGAGVRMGGNIPKQFQLLKSKPVLWHSVNAFAKAFEDIHIVLVIAEIYTARAASIIKEFPGRKFSIAIGGETRFHSVKNGLNLVEENSIVFVHDAVRCLVSADLIHKCYEETVRMGNAIPAIAATDTIRIETSEGNKQMDRDKVKIIQTPQTFFSNKLKQAFLQEYDPYFTDEASVAERTGVKINLIEGETSNIKITRPIDLVIAERILQERK